jgi:hypothetical protein
MEQPSGMSLERHVRLEKNTTLPRLRRLQQLQQLQQLLQLQQLQQLQQLLQILMTPPQRLLHLLVIRSATTNVVVVHKAKGQPFSPLG